MKDKKIERRTITVDRLEVRADGEGETPKIVGHAAVFDTFSEPIFGMFVERIQPGAFKRAIEEEQDVRALVNHDESAILGRTKSGTLELREDDEGLAIEIDPPDTSYAHDLIESIRRGDIDQMSFSFRATKELFSEGEGPNGEDVRDLIDVDLFDVSPVTFPAYPDTDLAVRKHKEWRDARKAADDLKEKIDVLELQIEVIEPEEDPPEKDPPGKPDHAIEVARARARQRQAEAESY